MVLDSGKLSGKIFMLAPIRHILPLTTIRRHRMLQAPGKVLVRKGQKVNANDVVAEASLSPKHLLLDIARSLSISPDKADTYIKCEQGMRVTEGDILAGPVGFFKWIQRSPCNGRVVLVGSGQIFLEVDMPPFGLKAGLLGDVVDLVDDRGVVIESTGALIQCVWGNGPIDAGTLSVLVKEPGQAVNLGQLDVSMRGMIILGGVCDSEDFLKAAADMSLRGLILASLSASLIPIATRMTMPIVLLEGFGNLAMNSAAFKLLSTNERREVAINAEAWDAYSGTRPEVFIALPASNPLPSPKDTDQFAPGQTVRVLRAPARGKVGVLTDLKGMAEFPSGLRFPAAELQLEDGETLVVPLANLEVLA